MALHIAYANNNIDFCLSNLSSKDRFVFDSILYKAETLMSGQCNFVLKCVQAYVTKTMTADTAHKTSVLQSCIFKTQVLLGVNKIFEQHKIIIQSLMK